MVYSHKKIGQPGPLTRILSCNEEDWDAMSEEAKNIVTTHVAPSYSTHPRTGDRYPAYNKPVAVIDWLAKNDILEEFILIIDADMIMRRKIIPEEHGAKRGLAVSAFFGYMIGVANELAEKHIPEVLPREDSLAGPVGRKGDQVGGFTMMESSDLRKVAPLWLKYTEDVREDPDAWKLTGDQYSKTPGDKPWISEMYGYSFACAKADVWHKTPEGMMLYPGYDASLLPYVLHYGLLWNIEQDGNKVYEFDKHWFYAFDPFICPPWDLDMKTPPGGLFPRVPSPSSFTTTGFALLKDLMSVEVPITLNAALCERHQQKCSPSPELERECAKIKAYERELDSRLAELANSLPDDCVDLNENCDRWAKEEECTNNAGYMQRTCRKACKVCVPRKGSNQVETVDPTSTTTNDLTDDNEDLYDPEEDDLIVRSEQKEVEDEKTEEEKKEDEEKAKEAAAKAQAEEFDAQQKEFEKIMIPKLQERCKRYPSWTSAQVERCLSFAEDGIEYDPLVFDFEDSDAQSDPFVINLDKGHQSSIVPGSNSGTFFVVLFFLLVTWKYRRIIHLMLLKRPYLRRKEYHLG